MSTKQKDDGEKGTALQTPIGVLSFPRLFKPEEYSGKVNYSATVAFAADADLKGLKAAVVKAAEEKWGKEKAAKLLKAKKIKTPFIENEGNPGYPEGGVHIRLKRREDFGAPGVFNWDKEPISEGDPNAKLFYPGAQVDAIVSVFTWDRQDGKGVGFGLEGIRFRDHGERIDGRVAAVDAFAEAEPPTAIDFDDLDDDEVEGEEPEVEEPEQDEDEDEGEDLSALL